MINRHAFEWRLHAIPCLHSIASTAPGGLTSLYLGTYVNVTTGTGTYPFTVSAGTNTQWPQLVANTIFDTHTITYESAGCQLVVIVTSLTTTDKCTG